MAISLNIADWQTVGGDANRFDPINVPAPNNISAGDLIVIVLSVKGLDSSDGISGSPTGFTRHIDVYSLADWSPDHGVFWKIADSGDESATEYTFTDSDGEKSWSATSMRITGHDATTPLAGVSEVIANSATGLTIPGISATSGNVLVSTMSLSLFNSASQTAYTQPSGMTEQVEIQQTHGRGVGMGIATENISSTGSTGDKSWSWTGSQNAVGSLFEIQAAAGGAITGDDLSSASTLEQGLLPITLNGAELSSSTTLDQGLLPITLSANGLSSNSVLDQSTIQTIILNGNELASPTTLDQGLLPITLSGNEMSSSTVLDQSTIQTIQLIGNALNSASVLDQGSIVGALVLVGDDLTSASTLEQGSFVTFTLSGDDLASTTNLDDGQLAVVLSGDALSSISSLDQSTIQTITLSGDGLSSDSVLQDGTLIIIGDATKVDLEAKELYTISLQVNSLYRISLNTKEQYTINLEENEVIE